MLNYFSVDFFQEKLQDLLNHLQEKLTKFEDFKQNLDKSAKHIKVWFTEVYIFIMFMYIYIYIIIILFFSLIWPSLIIFFCDLRLRLNAQRSRLKKSLINFTSFCMMKKQPV